MSAVNKHLLMKLQQVLPGRRQTPALIAAGLGFLLSLLVPGLWGAYGRILVFGYLLQVTMALSYDVIGGLLGYLHLGHGLFFGLGAYLTAIALGHGQTLLTALALALCGTVAAAALLGPAVFRLRGSVFALATLGLLFLGADLASSLSSWTGGAAGLSLPPDSNPRRTYLCLLAVTAATIVSHRQLYTSRLGLKLRTIRESEAMAESIGIDSGKTKRQALILSAVPAALAGGLNIREISFVVPQEAFGLENSLAPVLICLLIRPGTTWGPLVGAMILVGAQEFIWTSLPHFRMSLFGLLLILLGIMQTRKD